MLVPSSCASARRNTREAGISSEAIITKGKTFYNEENNTKQTKIYLYQKSPTKITHKEKSLAFLTTTINGLLNWQNFLLREKSFSIVL